MDNKDNKDNKYIYMSASELSRLIHQKEVKPSEICAAFLSRIEALESKVNAFITLDKESVMRRGKELDDIPVTPETSAVFGLPIAVKDNICTFDMPATCASKMLADFKPPYDATVVSNLREQGAVIMGKTNMDEFAMGSSCENSYFGASHNPHDLTRMTGGTSGGSAAAVAAGMTPLSLGSDTGGSIRQPASYCGAVGYKPTYGIVSRYGLLAYAGSFDTIGTITRTVSDAALLAHSIAGHDTMDATSVPKTILDYSNLSNILSNIEQFDVKGKKIGVPKEYFHGNIGNITGLNEDIRTAVMSAAETYKFMGAELIDISLPLTEYCLPVYHIIAAAEASSNLAKYDGLRYGYRAKDFDGKDIESLYVNSRTEGFGTEVKKRIIAGTYVLSAGNYDIYYKKARIVQSMIRQEFKSAFEKCDIILTPVTPNIAFKIGEKRVTTESYESYLTDIYTVPVNLAGLPAVSVPCGKDGNNMPVGVQLIGKRFDDGNLFGFARAFERESGISNIVATVAEVK